MSAITGIYHFNNDPISNGDGRNLMQALQHFPADDIQCWEGEGVFLGCHAQWITPESIGELLPYYDHESRTAITADAIIDNRNELFDRLRVEHERRKEMPDSRLILLAYHRWGEEAPKYLVGDFAFMIWDEKKRLLFGARDFSGTRTLYFYRNPWRFVFCTIIKPLFTLPYIKKELNEQWLAEFLAIPRMYDSVDSFSTVYKNIEQIPPAHTISVFNGSVRFSRYCRVTEGDKLQLKSNQEYEEAFREVFQSAITSRLRTHHQVGAHLSGGLDSGTVVSFAAKALRQENKRLHTFSYVPLKGFVDWTPRTRIADERPLIRETIRHVGNITEQYCDFEGKSPLSEVNDWLEILEMPYKFFINSFWIKGIHEQAHQQGIGILLKGSRGNYTISWGPAIDYYAKLLKKLKWIRLYRELNFYSRNTGNKKSRIIASVRKKAFPLTERILSKKEHDNFPLLINPGFAKRTNVFDKLQEHGVELKGASLSDFYKARKKQFEQLFFWNNDGTGGTKLSLRYGLWERDPTSDLRVIRFCLSVPDEQYVQNGWDRSLIRRATAGLLPDKVRLNQHIRGIQGADGVQRMAPFWGELLDEFRQLSESPMVSGFLNGQAIKDALSRVKGEPRPDYIFDLDFKILMRGLIVHRFIKQFV